MITTVILPIIKNEDDNNRYEESNNNVQEECIIRTIEQFCQQENSYYFVQSDWTVHLPSSSYTVDHDVHVHVNVNENDDNSCSPSENDDKCVSDWTTCRTLMIKWFQQVVHHLQMNTNSTAEIAVSYMDRCMSFIVQQKQQLKRSIDRNTFQLLCLACLYIASKLHEPICMDSKIVAKLSKNQHTVQQIEAMEVAVLNLLQWYVNPPTTATYIHWYMKLMPHLQQDQSGSRIGSTLDYNDKDYDTIHDTTITNVQLMLGTKLFLTAKPSIIAYCSLMNTLERMDNKKIQANIGIFGYQLAKRIGLPNCNAQSIVSVQNQLLQAVSNCDNDVKLTSSSSSSSSTNRNDDDGNNNVRNSHRHDKTTSSPSTGTTNTSTRTDYQKSPCAISDH